MNRFIYRTGSDNFGQTKVENIFINEFMADANGDYIKVYLYGLKNSQNHDLSGLTTEDLAERLSLTESDILNAWNYWEKQGIIKTVQKDGDRDIVYLNITEKLYNSKKEPRTGDSVEDAFDDLIHNIEKAFGGYSLPFKWNDQIQTWYYKDGFEPLTIMYAVEETIERLSGKQASMESQMKYLASILKNWKSQGLKTYQQAIDYNNKVEERNNIGYSVLKILGIRNRALMARERKLVDRWIEEYGLDKELILYAAEKSRKPQVDYVDGILRHWHENGWTTVDEVVDQVPEKESHGQTKTLFEPVNTERAEAFDQFEEDIFASYKAKIAELTGASENNTDE